MGAGRLRGRRWERLLWRGGVTRIGGGLLVGGGGVAARVAGRSAGGGGGAGSGFRMFWGKGGCVDGGSLMGAAWGWWAEHVGHEEGGRMHEGGGR